MEKQKCHLCKVKDVYEIKSHYTPAVITKYTFGDRNKEKIYTIDASAKTIDKYVGPQHPQTESVEVKIAPNVKKGIFCKDCENNFGKLEQYQKDLTDEIDCLGRGGYKVQRDKAVKYLALKIDPKILSLLLYTIVWRQCLEQSLDGMGNPLPADEFEKLRQLVLANIYKSEAEILQTEFTNFSRQVIFTTYQSPILATFVNPHPKNTNPRLFFISGFNLLYWLEEPVTKGLSDILFLDERLLDDSFNLNNPHKPFVPIISEGAWAKISFALAKNVADTWERS